MQSEKNCFQNSKLLKKTQQIRHFFKYTVVYTTVQIRKIH